MIGVIGMTITPMQRHRGRLIMLTPNEAIRYREYLADRRCIGRHTEVTTRRGARRHLCTIVAVRFPGFTHPLVASRWEWASALSRERFWNAPINHRESHGRFILRIDASTAANMVGRYLSI